MWSYARSAAFEESIGWVGLWFLTVAVPKLCASVVPLACSAFPNPSCRYPVLSQVMLSLQGSGMIEAVETGKHSRTPLGCPYLPSPTALLDFLCIFASYARKVQAGHGGGAKEAQGHSSSVATASTSKGQQAHYKGGCSPAQMAQRDCEYYSLRGASTQIHLSTKTLLPILVIAVQ